MRCVRASAQLQTALLLQAWRSPAAHVLLDALPCANAPHCTRPFAVCRQLSHRAHGSTATHPHSRPVVPSQPGSCYAACRPSRHGGLAGARQHAGHQQGGPRSGRQPSSLCGACRVANMPCQCQAAPCAFFSCSIPVALALCAPSCAQASPHGASCTPRIPTCRTTHARIAKQPQALGISPRFAHSDDELFVEDDEDRALFAHALPWRALCVKMGWGQSDVQVRGRTHRR